MRINQKTGATILLIMVFMARGTSFLFSKTLMQDMSPMSVLAVRFVLAFIILAVLFRKKLLACNRKCLINGMILGSLYTICMIFEMYGLRLIDTGVSSLIENMAIVLVPLYAAVLTRSLPKPKTMLCAVLAVIGVGFLSLDQGRSVGGGWGILLILLAAMTLVLVCSCFGFAFQPLGQKYLPAETAAVLTVVNPLTASVLGTVVANEHLTAFKIVGYIIILATLIFYNLKDFSIRR